MFRAPAPVCLRTQTTGTRMSTSAATAVIVEETTMSCIMGFCWSLRLTRLIHEPSM